MKKILFTVLTIVSIATSAFAKDEPAVDDKVLTAFSSDFNSATNVNWTMLPNFAKAAFTLNGKNMDAFYSFSGEMLGATHAVDYETLPKKAKGKIAKKYADYTVRETLSFQCPDEICYFVAVENDAQKLILKVANNMVTVFKKMKKG